MAGPGSLGGEHALIVTGVCALLLPCWCAILSWSGVFGLLLVPYRLVRRHQRKDRQRALRHDEMLR